MRLRRSELSARSTLPIGHSSATALPRTTGTRRGSRTGTQAPGRREEELERRLQDAERIAEEQKKAATAGRRTAQVAIGGLAVALLVAGVAVWQYVLADQAKTAADEAKGDALTQRDRAEKAAVEATRATKLATVRQWAAQARAEAGTPHSLLLGLNSISLAKQVAPRVNGVHSTAG